MNSKHINRAVVRDPGTVYLCWDTKIQDNASNSSAQNYKIIIKDISTDNIVSTPVDPSAGKHYLHELQPDSYYKISLYNDTECLLDFGTIHTLKATISNEVDPTSKWHTDKNSLIRLTGGSWQAIGSSNRNTNG